MKELTKMNKNLGYRKTTVVTLAVLIALLLMFPAIRVDAGPVKLEIIPSLNIQEEWDSNVYDATNHEVSSMGFRISPGLELKMMSSDNVTMTFGGGYDKVWHHSSDAKAADDGSWYASVDSSGAWSISPNLTVTPSFYFINTKDSNGRASFIPMGNPLMPSISSVSYVDTKRQSTGGALDFIYLISPTWNANLRMDYLDERFKRSGSATPGVNLTNTTQAGVRAGANYVISPSSQAGMFAEMRLIDFDNSPDTKVYSAGLTYSHQFNQFLKLTLDAGASHLQRENETGSDSGDTETGPMANLLLEFNWQSFHAELYGNAVYSGGSGFEDVTRDYTTGIRIEHQFTQTISGKLSGYFQNSKSVFQSDAVNINTLHVSASLMYQPWEVLSFFLRGDSDNQKSSDSFGESIDNYMVVLGVKIAFPYNIF